MKNYRTKCKQCGKKLKDPADEPIYVVRTDEYFCNQECLTKNAQEEITMAD